MKCGKKVSILFHELARYNDTYHPFIWYLAKLWKKSGIDVEILRGIPDNLPATDLLIVHVDLTFLPAEYAKFVNRFPGAINGRITDISKRKISANLLGPDDAYDGSVIVKTNLNYGGLPELRLENRSGEGRMFLSAIQRPWRKIDCMDPGKYPIFETMNDVPPGVWRNPHLVVEKFIPERHGEFYGNRTAFFMGRNSLCRKVYSYSPIVKGSGIVKSEDIEMPADLEKFRKTIGLDYGKIDYVVHDGVLQVLDVNKTLGAVEDDEVNWIYAAPLAEGLLPFFDKADASPQGV
jgi:hypothetical protein